MFCFLLFDYRIKLNLYLDIKVALYIMAFNFSKETAVFTQF